MDISQFWRKSGRPFQFFSLIFLSVLFYINLRLWRKNIQLFFSSLLWAYLQHIHTRVNVYADLVVFTRIAGTS